MAIGEDQNADAVPYRCGLGRARGTYIRRQPERLVLHQVVRQDLETFLAEARLRGGGDGGPRFVERELREFLTCSDMTRGFARIRWPVPQGRKAAAARSLRSSVASRR